jgi:hypothetical protein
VHVSHSESAYCAVQYSRHVLSSDTEPADLCLVNGKAARDSFRRVSLLT